MRKEREILEHAVRAVSEQAAAASAIVDEALDAGLDGSHPVTIQAKMLRLELLNVKAELRARARAARPRLLELQPNGPLGRWARRLSRTLGAPGASAARQA